MNRICHLGPLESEKIGGGEPGQGEQENQRRDIDAHPAFEIVAASL